MRDFTISIYQSLLSTLKEKGYAFQTFSQYLKDPAERVIMLRHDVDDRKENSLAFAKIQADLGIVGTYYFRMVPQSFDPETVKAISAMGHEIGYHYEDMDFAAGDPEKAIRLFEKHLFTLRELVPVETICMHGSPRSPYDNRDIWQYTDYRTYGIIGEPYLDLDFGRVFYLTDTGRRWDGHRVSIRDKTANPHGLSFHSTLEIIEAIRSGKLPPVVMMNFHPQRWTEDPVLWIREWISQKAKNQAKYILIKWRGNRQSQSAKPF